MQTTRSIILPPLIALLGLGLLPLSGCMKAERVGTDTSSPEGFILGGVNLGVISLGSGSGGSGTGSGGTPYLIGGTVTGLTAGSITIQNNGGDNLPISSNGSFTFSTSASSYNVTIVAQPVTLRCIVQGGTGTASANVTSIVVTCPMAYSNSLVWMRCTHGQVWNAATGTCQGTATLVNYCATAGTCNDGTPETDAFFASGGAVTGHLNGTGTSGAFSACNALSAGAGTYGKTNWRVPWRSEIKQLVQCSSSSVPLVDLVACNGGSPSPTIDQAAFPNTQTAYAYVSSSASPNTGFGPGVYSTYFSDGHTGGGTYQNLSQYYVRCVAN